jgi:hypothetical protein
MATARTRTRTGTDPTEVLSLDERALVVTQRFLGLHVEGDA